MSEFPKHVFYRSNAAISVWPCTSRDHVPAVMIEAASRVNGRIEWDKKISIQLRGAELLSLLSTLIRVPGAESFKAQGHGQTNGISRWLEVKALTPEGYEFRVGFGKQCVLARASTVDIVMVREFAIQQIQSALGLSSAEHVLRLARDAVSPINTTQPIAINQ